MTDMRDTSSSSWRGYRSYYCDGYNYDVYDREYKLREENYNLNLKLENLEKDIEEYIYRESELTDRIRLLESQNLNLEEKINRLGKLGSLPPKDEEVLRWENRKLKDDNLKSELKLELLTHFINKLQSLTSKKNEKPGFTLLENMDLNSLRDRLRVLESEIIKVFDYKFEKEAQKGLVMGNSELVNKNLKEVLEENENIR